MKTRRFRALNGATGKYSRIVEKIAIYDDNGKQTDCCIIHTDNEGREYYYPSNPNNKLGLFSDRPKDAIECIRNGFGDGFKQSKILGMTLDHVVRFLDRNYGEDIRQKTIDGWKNTKFAFGVKFIYINAISSGRLITKNNTLMCYGDEMKDVLTFETEAEASAFIEEVTKKAKEYLDAYLNLETTGDKDWDYEHIYKPFFNEIEGKMENGTESVYWKAFSGLAEENRKNNPEYKMEIVQIVLP